jgi:tetratricopeptide (TPR) repeat protein
MAAGRVIPKRSFASAVLTLLLPGMAFAQATAAPGCDPAPARATSVQGTVESTRAGQTAWQPVKLNDTFCPGDQIRVQSRSRADIALLNQSVLRLNANSAIVVEAPKEQRTGVVDLVRGAVHFFSRGPNSLDVKTPFTIAGVRGTEFYVAVEPQRTLLTVFEGTVAADNPSGSLLLKDGQSGLAEQGKAPVLRTVVRPRDAVHWALYYPPVIQDRQAPAYRAQTLLAVGAVDEARSDIQRALQGAPNNADALSLQSIMTLVQGDKDQALQLAQAATQAAPSSASALVARSYAEQARFDLNAARASVERAVQVEPNNALAWARLAELHSSFGELDKAMSAAQRAVQIDANLSRTQTVLGFAQLTSIQTAQAKQSFEKAIALDQADPLPRLGLGLAKIRGGDLNRGSRDIETAASLDPNNALVRSYLGKAYYEEKRSPLDQREFAMAKQLDPKDPTPWFYDAIAEQTTNRPVEALQNLEKARELNDNRAVYRSQLLLDSDAAARAASQARIFSELGFQQRALVEGWDAVNRDPTNFSAHRFLADSYSVLPRHEIARVSELLQSQLLSPVTNTPLQPRLGESNLFLISSGGPGIASFNEFNPLFNRDGLTFQGSGFAGENGTSGADAVVSGIRKNVGFSVGYTHFETDGWRTNADQKDTMANAFVQIDVSPQTSIQGELRSRDLKRGDTPLRFFDTDFFPGQRNEEKRSLARLGIRHAFSPDSIVLGSFIYNDADTSLNDQQFPDPFVPGLLLKNNEKSWTGEMQHLFRSGRFNLTSGVGYVSLNGTLDSTFTTVFPPPDDVIRASQSTDAGHANAYTYAQIKAQKNLTFTVGASADLINADSDDIDDKQQLNPKLGVSWFPNPNTHLRAAAFRVLKRTLTSNQTIEPTQVVGFNQFFDDLNGTDSWNYGGAVDQRFSKTLYGGASLTYRRLDVPFFDATDPLNVVVRDANWNETLGRAYLFWAPHRLWALSAEYLYERLKRDENLTAGVLESDTHRFPLGVRFIHPSGFSSVLTATYWNQSGTFTGVLDNDPRNGSDDFVTVDFALRYRLPKRYGIVAVGVTNLTDEKFNYFDADFKNPVIQPNRMAYVKVTLALP